MDGPVPKMDFFCRLFTFITGGAPGVPPATITEKDLIEMKYEATHFEKEVTWLFSAYLVYVNDEAISKDRVVGAEELRAVLKGKKAAMDNKKSTLVINL